LRHNERKEIMQLKEIMSRDVEVIRPEATLQEAAQRMKAHNIGYVLIREGEQTLGIVTDRDMTVRAAAEGRNPTATRVNEVMTPVLICCFEDDEVAAAVRCMKEQQIRHLAVLDRNHHLVGVISLYALAMHTRDEMLAGTAIRWPA
jgi:CBS domain-containing protein